jgi:hypothetical protein
MGSGNSPGSLRSAKYEICRGQRILFDQWIDLLDELSDCVKQKKEGRIMRPSDNLYNLRD